jgi:hypothetical protein
LPLRVEHPIFKDASGRDLCTPAMQAQQGKARSRTTL